MAALANPSYFGGDQAVAQQVQLAMRRNPSQFAAMMQQNPQLGTMLASIFSPEQLSMMMADVGWSQGDANPPPPQQPSLGQALMMGGGRGMGMGGMGMGRMGMMAQGGLVDLPGYYERGGEMLPVPTDEQLERARHSLRPQQPLYDPPRPLSEYYDRATNRIPSELRNYPAPLRIKPPQWENFLAGQPRSTNIEDTRGQPPPEQGDMPLARILRQATGGLIQLQRGGMTTPKLGISEMNTAFKQAHFGGINTRAAESAVMGRAPGVHLINSHVPGRVDRIPMRARTGSYVMPADVVSGLGQGNTHAGARMWGQAISHSIGPMGIQNAIKARTMKTPSLRMPSPGLNPKTGIGRGAFVGFADGGETTYSDKGDYTPIITAGGELIIDPEIVEALGQGDAEAGKNMLAESVNRVRKQTVQHLKELPGPVK